jgi:putative ABC transport system permease protein
MSTLAGDARFTLRLLRRSPGFAVLAITTMALGIGATAATFTIVHTLLLTPLPYRDSDRIVRLMMTPPAQDSRGGAPVRTTVGVSAAEIADLQSRTRMLTDLGTAGPVLIGLAGAHEEGARLQGTRISSSLLRLFGARAAHGRLPGPADEAQGAGAVIVLSHATWQRHFGSDPAVVGRPIALQSVLGPRRQSEHTVIGVMAPDFRFPDTQTQFWMPFQTGAAGGGAVMRGPLVARLADGVSPAAAAGEIGPIVRDLRQHRAGTVYELVRERDQVAAPVKPAVLILAGAVVLMLLLACVNVANLLLVRASAREREFAIRAAIGGTRGRLIGQALVESTMLATFGGAAGLALAFGAVRGLKALGSVVGRVDLGTSPALPRLDEIAVDGWALAITAAATIVAGVAFGLAPALRHARSDPMFALRRAAGGPGAPAAGGGASLLDILVVLQVGIATVLLIGGGLLARSFVTLVTVDSGYEASNVLTFQVSLPVDRYPDDYLRTFAEELAARLRSLPGVEAAAYANQLPMVKLRDSLGLWRTPDAKRPAAPNPPDARFVSLDYLHTMGIRVVAGRGFTEHDRVGQPRVLLINEALARREFPNENPVGRMVYMGRDLEPWLIAGVVRNVRQHSLEREPDPQFFGDLRQWPRTTPLFPLGPYFAVRASGDLSALAGAVRGALRDLAPHAALFNVAPMEQVVAATVARPRLYAVFLGIFACIGGALAVIGIYGVLAYAVSRRTRELGIRMALGAQRRDVLTLVFRQAAILTAAGLATGLAAAAVATRVLQGLLFGITPLDASVFAGVAAALSLTAMTAAFVPARRAVRVDPAVALRAE